MRLSANGDLTKPCYLPHIALGHSMIGFKQDSGSIGSLRVAGIETSRVKTLQQENPYNELLAKHIEDGGI
jgi:hypothetical protein